MEYAAIVVLIACTVPGETAVLLSSRMASGLCKSGGCNVFPAVDVVLVDWDSMDQAIWRAEFLGERGQPPESDTTVPPRAPLWQSSEASADIGII